MRRHSFLGRRSDSGVDSGLFVGDTTVLLLLVVVRTDADDSSKEEEEVWKGRGMMMTRNMKIVIIGT
jgi:hypothetical protein